MIPMIPMIPTTRSTQMFAAAVLAACGLAVPAMAQLRVAMWNISNYAGNDGREPSFQTAIYASYQGRSMTPDVFLAEEITSQAGADGVVAFLNSAAGSPGDWAAAQFFNGPDTDLVFCYRTSKVQFLGQTLVLAGGNINGAPRDIRRYDVRLVGYASPGASLAIYADHMKSGSGCCGTGTDQARRLIEATAIRDDANALPAGWQIIVAGDFNIQSSTQGAYQELVGSLTNNRGRFADPINSPGNWNNSPGFAMIHTQAPGGDPANTSGMDDRLDFILLGTELVNGDGFDYIGNPSLAYSTTTWNDPNHSYRSWGNDGSFYNSSINTTTNAMVGPTIATAIKTTCDADAPGGHLAVFLDLRVPPVADSPATIDFGSVAQNSLAQQTLTVSNAGDVAKWNVGGIANLSYSLAASAGLAAPAGSFIAPPGGAGNNHSITMATTTVGPFNGTVTLNSNAPDQPARIVTVTGTVVGAPVCYANCDGSTTAPVLNVLDFACFLNAFAANDTYANCDHSTSLPVLNVLDFSCFLNGFAAGCR